MSNEKFFKEESRKNWFSQDPIINDDIKVGCLQRIADATEKMAQGYIQLENSRDYHKRRAENLEEENDRLRRRVAAYKGLLKKKTNHP